MFRPWSPPANPKRFAFDSAERIAGNEMALDVEGVLDRDVNGEERFISDCRLYGV